MSTPCQRARVGHMSMKDSLLKNLLWEREKRLSKKKLVKADQHSLRKLMRKFARKSIDTDATNTIDTDATETTETPQTTE